MKKAFHIVCVAWIILVSSCVVNEQEIMPKGGESAKGFVHLKLLTGGADEEDYIHTVRCIAFDEASSATPRLDFNEMVPMKEGEKDASRMDILLEMTDNPDKMIAVIINEPAGLSSKLTAITSPQMLEELPVDFARILNDNHTALHSTGMPMTGVIWVGDDHDLPLHETPAEAQNNRLSIEVERVVARIDFWLEVAEEQVTTGIEEGQTQITLTNTYDQSYFIRGNTANETWENAQAEKNFGRIQTVDPALFTNSERTRRIWTAPATQTINGKGSLLYVCSFYTPERTSRAPGDADKLGLILENIPKNEAYTGGTFTISTITHKEGGSVQPFETVHRNNVYEITARVHPHGVDMSMQVLDWNEAPIPAPIGKPHFLTVSEYTLEIRNLAGINTPLTLATDVDEGWTAEYYNNPECTDPITDGWIILDREQGEAAPAGTPLTVTLADRLIRTGYIKFTAGRMSLTVKVSRLPITFEFAHSNVLSLDGGQTATFAESWQDLHDKGIKANMQGLMFKWASLIGVGSLGAEAGNMTIWFNKTGRIFSSWSQIPFGNTSFNNPATPEESYDAFANYNGGLGYSASAGGGDICRYISAEGWVKGKWRIPTTEEWILLTGESLQNGIPSGYTNQTVSERYGLNLMTSGYWFGVGVNESTPYEPNAMEYPPEGTYFLPASGFRVAEQGLANSFGVMGGYWSTRPRYVSQVTTAYHLRFDRDLDGGKNNPAYIGPRDTGFTVRCIRIE